VDIRPIKDFTRLSSSSSSRVRARLRLTAGSRRLPVSLSPPPWSPLLTAAVAGVDTLSSHCRVRSRSCARLRLRRLHARLPPTTSSVSSGHAAVVLAVVDRRLRLARACYLLSLPRLLTAVDRRLARAAVLRRPPTVSSASSGQVAASGRRRRPELSPRCNFAPVKRAAAVVVGSPPTFAADDRWRGWRWRWRGAERDNG
jgi:hypothetical protein